MVTAMLWTLKHRERDPILILGIVVGIIYVIVAG
jgi:hypothetical protein